MATNFPGGVDSFPRPQATTNTDDPGFELDIVIDNLSDAVEAVETRVLQMPGPLGADDNYVTDAEKVKLANLSGVNTGDQTLPTWSTISGKPAVIAAGATQADARTAIGAGTSSLALGTTPGTALDASTAPELIRDTIGTALVAGTNVTITPNDAGDTITIAAASGGGGGGVGSVLFTAKRTLPSTNLASGAFTTYPLDTVETNIGGGSYNGTTFIYTIPATGLYLCLGSIRVQDNTPARNVAIGIGTTNADGPHVAWRNIGGVQRDVRQYTRVARFTAGDLVRLYIYSEASTLPTHDMGAPSGQFMTLVKLAD